MSVAEFIPPEILLRAKLEKYFGNPDADPRLNTAEVWCGRVIAEFRKPPGEIGASLPWSKTHNTIRLRSGEVSLWPGINGHGKSLLTSHVALDLIAQGQRVCIGSLEMLPVKTLKRMTRQAVGCADPTDEAIRGFFRWLKLRLRIYDQHGRADPKNMLAVIRYAAIEAKVQHFFLDSLMMVCRGEDDYNGQKDFVTELCAIAKDTDCHIHLIHHTRKLGSEKEVPGKFDAKGSGSITDQVDNVFTVWRNKGKEQRVAAGESSTEPDAMLVCDKQRNGEWEGRIHLWFDPSALTYRGDERQSFNRGYDIPIQSEPGEAG